MWYDDKNTWLKQIPDQILNFIKTRKEEIQDMTSVIDISGFGWVRSSFAKKRWILMKKKINLDRNRKDYGSILRGGRTSSFASFVMKRKSARQGKRKLSLELSFLYYLQTWEEKVLRVNFFSLTKRLHFYYKRDISRCITTRVCMIIFSPVQTFKDTEIRSFSSVWLIERVRVKIIMRRPCHFEFVMKEIFIWTLMSSSIPPRTWSVRSVHIRHQDHGKKDKSWTERIISLIILFLETWTRKYVLVIHRAASRVWINDRMMQKVKLCPIDRTGIRNKKKLIQTCPSIAKESDDNRSQEDSWHTSDHCIQDVAISEDWINKCFFVQNYHTIYVIR